MTADLHVGSDAEKTVVAAYPLKTRTGRARRRRTGSLIESLPVLPSGRSREVRITFLARLSLPVLLLGALAFVAGVPAPLLTVVIAATLGLTARADHRRAQVATFKIQNDQDRVLRTREERAAFSRALVAAHRVRRTWPELGSMIDPASADHSLTCALDDLATLLVRRQEIRRLRTGLDGVRREAVPADSRAVLALAEQRERTEQLWLATAEQANHILRSIETAALAGETFVRERQIGATARQAELVLARLTAGAAPVDAAPALAEHTTAVLDAYRELSEREYLLP
jgi:hypothetical protein